MDGTGGLEGFGACTLLGPEGPDESWLSGCVLTNLRAFLVAGDAGGGEVPPVL